MFTGDNVDQQLAEDSIVLQELLLQFHAQLERIANQVLLITLNAQQDTMELQHRPKTSLKDVQFVMRITTAEIEECNKLRGHTAEMDLHAQQDLRPQNHIPARVEVFAQQDSIVLRKHLVHRIVETGSIIRIKEDSTATTVQLVSFAQEMVYRHQVIAQLVHGVQLKPHQLGMNKNNVLLALLEEF